MVFFELVILCVGNVRPAHVLYLLPILVMKDILVVIPLLILLDPEIVSAANWIFLEKICTLLRKSYARTVWSCVYFEICYRSCWILKF